MDNFNLQKFVKKSKNEFYTNLYEGKKKHSMEEGNGDVEESAPGYQHDCAAHVMHESHGYGLCLQGRHTLVETTEGHAEVTHYDVMFKSGNVVEKIPVNELKVITSESHKHSKKKMEEEEHDEDHKMEGEIKEEAPIKNVVDVKTEEFVGTHQHGKGFKANETGKKLGYKDHPTSIPNGTKMDTDTIEENHQSLDKEVADRIEGLLRIPLKAKFLATGFDLINDLLEDDEFDVADIVSHLANELERMYYKASKPSFYGGLEEGKEEKETIKEMTSVEFMELLPSVAGGIAALAGSSLAIPAFIEKAKAGKYGSKLKNLAKGIESAGGSAAGARNVAEQESGISQDSIDTAMSQAGMKEQEDEEVEMEAGVEDTIEMPAEIPTEETDNKEVFSQLVDAYEAAKELGDEKLTRQLANTITYFNKTIIFGDEE